MTIEESSAQRVGLERVDAIVGWLEKEVDMKLEVLGRAPGNSHDGWVLRRQDRSGSRLLVRLEPEQGPFLRYDGAREASLLGQLRTLGVPVPTVITAQGADRLGVSFMVTEWVDGEVHTPGSLAQLPDEHRHTMARELADVLARLHAAPTAALPALRESDRARPVDALFEQFDAILDGLEAVESLTLDYVRAWLAAHIDGATRESTLVHGDFRLANLVWAGRRIVGILDWETAQLADPLFDLGWLCMGARSDGDAVMGLVPREELVAMYTEASGREVTPRALLFWQIAAGWVRGCTELRLLDLAHTSPAGRQVDARDLSWQFGSYRTDHELLQLVEAYERSEVEHASR
jgi:aminoglycoside phosphotransferase (APT) family kinase protein